MLRAAPGEYLVFEPEEAPPITPAAATPELPSAKARRHRTEVIERLRQEVRRRLEARLARPALSVRPPRYDEVFFNGVRWLDEQAGGSIEPFEGEAVFSPDIWKSPGRSDPDVS
jgi:hypothetical protein